MKILITGAAGYTGSKLALSFEGKHELRLMDLHPFDTPHEKIIGDVADLDTVCKAVEDVDAIIIGHMAPRQNDGYALPTLPFDVNVRGTANLFHAAAQKGIDRVCLLSSVATVGGLREGDFFCSRDHPRIPSSLSDYYSLTKVLQELIADAFHRLKSMKVAILRLGWVVDADTRVTKYGKPITTNHPSLIDPRDVGEVARRALELNDLTFEIFYVVGGPEADAHYDVAYTRERLGWKPAFRF